VVRRRQLVAGGAPGRAFLTYVALYAVGRSAIEAFRGDVARGVYLDGWVSTSQLIALVLFTGAAGGLVWLRHRHPAEADDVAISVNDGGA
jgi:prolipoprotein diacylglyceryltransferase